MIDKINLEKHEVEMRVLNSEANRNNSVADSALASSLNIGKQKENAQQDRKYIPPNFPPTMIEPLKEMGTPRGGITYHDPGGLGDMHIPGGLTAAQMLEEMVGEPENPLNWPRMMQITLNHINKQIEKKGKRNHKKYFKERVLSESKPSRRQHR